MSYHDHPCRDTKQEAAERAVDLLSKMSLEEKFGQIQCFNPAAWSNDNLERDYPYGVGGVSFLVANELDTKEEAADLLRKLQKRVMALSKHKIPAIFHIETLCGVMMPGSTSFPSGIGQASTWDPALQEKMAGSIRQQARAIGVTQAFAPVLDIAHDARFGRQGESYGEDPTLASAMGAAYVRGMQNRGNLSQGLLATGKHFLGYMNPKGGIHASSSDIPTRRLREVYAKPFQAAMTLGNLQSIMNAYCVIDGEPVAGSKAILTDLLRNEMGFTGLTVSDYEAVRELERRHKVCSTPFEAGKRALEAGMDMELPSKACYGDELLEWIRSNESGRVWLDRSVKRILTEKFALGLFENPFPAEPEQIRKVFSCGDIRKCSLQSAKESLVLLKNDGLLPLSRSVKKIALIGYHAASARAMFGGYTFVSMLEGRLGAKNTMAGVNIDMPLMPGGPEPHYEGSMVEMEKPGVEELVKKFSPRCTSLLKQLRKECPQTQIQYAFGYPYAGCDTSENDEALKAARDADVVIVTLGGKYGWGSVCSTGEGIDSTNVNLPPCQEAFLEKLSALHKKTVAVHFDGRPVSSDAVDQYVNAVIEAWSPGENGAKAIVAALFGDYNPGGKLPVSIAYNAGQIPIYYNHENGSSYHVGTLSEFSSYVDCPRTPRYPFGYGLSYTRFKYENLQIENAEMNPEDTLTVTAEVQDVGDRVGDEVVQLYVRDRYASMVRPVKELAGFLRIHLAAGETKKVRFQMPLSQLAFLDREMRWKIEAGTIDVMVGSSSEDIRLSGSFEIRSDAYIDAKSRSFFAKADFA